uniref:Uncharacterized protein n=1 Tax=Mycena chlorophos TaxID=658473 RepID=A0ABQ0LBW6_MYCCL|nr:predicted protein [Mycena chlorophos]
MVAGRLKAPQPNKDHLENLLEKIKKIDDECHSAEAQLAFDTLKKINKLLDRTKPPVLDQWPMKQLEPLTVLLKLSADETFEIVADTANLLWEYKITRDTAAHENWSIVVGKMYRLLLKWIQENPRASSKHSLFELRTSDHWVNVTG